MFILGNLVKKEHSMKTKFDPELNAFVVRMPDFITLEELKTWSRDFLKILKEKSNLQTVSLLLDTNTHAFESIECLKFLREFLTGLNQMKSGLCRGAFVAPIKYREPEVVSSKEAYFSHFEDARVWLKEYTG